ncbi:hypothetical protein [Rhizobium hidalgonense]|uniref:hypothetical protein n=1 Tax=Rhizobium hidalgonense TaxID=1538159 RepID=UPI0011066BA0|nr:hypothetical protein [Rhizobium hidalgonense]QKK23490.1 hypothetical protein FFM81_009075 [Rhizobium hidalgonense]
MRDVPTIEPRRKGRSGMQSMLIPSQQMVAEQIRSAQQGVFTGLGVLRRRLAVQYGAGACCPVTVQRHLRAIAELSFGVLEKGEPVSTVTPYWRMVDPLATRLAGGPSRIPERLAAEPGRDGEDRIVAAWKKIPLKGQFPVGKISSKAESHK